MTGIIPAGARVTVARVREVIGVPAAVRADGARDVLAVPAADGAPLPGEAAVRLALGGWPEEWRDCPQSGPGFLVALRGTGRSWRIAGVWETDPARWGQDAGSGPRRRLVPLAGVALVPSAVLAGAVLDAPLVFGWPDPEERYAFL
jgi:hypothetical protein